MTVSLAAGSTRHEQAVETLAKRESPVQVLAAVRFIKNAIIGNPTKKDLYLHSLGLAPTIVECLSAYAAEPLLAIEITTVVGSLANGSYVNVETLIAAGAVPPLLDTLSSSDAKLVDAGVRALRSIVQRPLVPTSQVFQLSQATHIRSLIALLSDARATDSHSLQVHIAEVAASILARISEYSSETRDAISAAGATQLLVRWLDMRWSTYPKIYEAVLDALASLCRDNPRVSKSVAHSSLPTGERVINILFTLVRDKRSSMRLAAATCITHMYRTGSVPREHQQSITLLLLPTVIRLFSDTSLLASSVSFAPTTISERSMALFGFLVAENTDLQLAAAEGDAIVKLAQTLTNLVASDPVSSQQDDDAKTSSKPSKAKEDSSNLRSPDFVFSQSSFVSNDKHRESALLAIADVCSLREECRKQVIDAKLLPVIVASLSHQSTGIRIAACRCTRSLSRSVKNLRTSLMDAGIAAPLFRLLYDPSVPVQIEASATLCNIVLDFSPMKKIVLDQGGVKRLVELIDTTERALRLNAVWALKNIIYQTDSPTKGIVMQQLGWQRLLRLIDDNEVLIQEQALNLLRNIACGKEDVDAVFDGFGDVDILSVLERKLMTMDGHAQIVLQTLYILVNFGIGGLERKSAVMGRKALLQKAFTFLEHENAQIRIAAIWIVINLTWLEDAGSADRVALLRSMGVEDRLRRLVEDDSLDVKDRAKTALVNMQGVNAVPSFFTPGISGSATEPAMSPFGTSPSVASSSTPSSAQPSPIRQTSRDRSEFDPLL
ncbi:armadillo-type protein [Entophlyctis helioformis]|nr:armadillo-type protein [Entophlyctis helioformis]